MSKEHPRRSKLVGFNAWELIALEKGIELQLKAGTIDLTSGKALLIKVCNIIATKAK